MKLERTEVDSDYNPLVFRNGVFAYDCADFFYSKGEEIKVFKEDLRKKKLKMSDAHESYRVINNWASSGLLEGTQEDEGSWRKFSTSDMCWIFVIRELRKVGFTLDKIKKLQDIIFGHYTGENKEHRTNYFDYAIVRALQKYDVYVVVLPDGTGDMLFGREITMIDALHDSDRSKSYFVIRFNKIVAEVFNKESIGKPNLNSFDLTEKEKELFAEIRLTDDVEVNVKAKEGVITKMAFKTKEINPENAIDKLRKMIKEGGKKEIVFKMEDGKIVYSEQTNKT